MEFSVSIPLDSDGFVRRECPNCERELKWFYGQTDEAPDDWEDPAEYVCPYCNTKAPADQWLTQSQVTYIEQIMAVHAEEYITDELNQMTRRINRSGPLKMSVKGGAKASIPPPLGEPNDMVAVEPPCHPFEPIKVLEGWADPLHCIICGTEFVVD